MVRTRIAPSPTGPLHIGTARTALFNYLFAKQNGGEFVLRIEDTDVARSSKEFEDEIIDGLSWLNIKWDGDATRQSERGEIYKSYIKKLEDNNLIYEEPAREGKGTAKILAKPTGDISFLDLIRGEVTFVEGEITDLVVEKPDGTPTYNFAVAVDDHEMEISHVIRGEDHISNTPKQIMVYRALGWELPAFAHLPLILSKDRSKLSKRHGAIGIHEFRSQGYLPEAMINFMALLGWHPKDEKEIFTLDELMSVFSLEDVQKGGAIFDTAKLDWINQQHIQRLSKNEYKARLEEFLSIAVPETFVELTQQRVSTLKEASEELKWLATPDYTAELLNWKDTSLEQTKQNLTAVLEIISNLREEAWNNIKNLENALLPFADKNGRGEVLWPLRVALSGAEKSPSPFELAALLGKKETLKRVESSIKKLS